MRLGENVRRVRRERGLTLTDLSRRSGVSVSMLSKIERNEKNPTVNVACKIAEGLDATLSQLIAEQPRQTVHVVRAADRRVFIDPKSGFERHILGPTFPQKGIEFLYNVIPPGGSSGEFPPHRPGVEEYLVVAQGAVEAVFDAERHRLEAGDSLFFAADVTHRFDNVGPDACAYYLVINSCRLARGEAGGSVGG